MTDLLHQVTVERFRGLADVNFAGLGPSNLIVGGNNSGKTSVLEALRIFGRPFATRSWVDTARARDSQNRQTIARDVEWLFPHESGYSENFEGTLAVSARREDSSQRIEANCKRIERLTEHTETVFDEETETAQDIRFEETQSGLSVQVRRTCGNESIQNGFTVWEGDWFPLSLFKDKDHIPTRMIAPASHRTELPPLQSLSEPVLEGVKRNIVNLIGEIDPRIRNIEIVAHRMFGSTSIYADQAGLGHIPLSNLGDGVRRIILIAASIPLVSNGLLLIDEIEAGIHIGALERVFAWMLRACAEWKVQLFATTHSPEAVDTILKVEQRMRSGLVGYRLERQDDRITSLRLEGDALHSLRHVTG